jgi:hypothetical protein
MKNSDDIDRQLDEWLREGPTRPSDAPLEQAIEHARAHPRRPDPLGFLRRDPMAGRQGPLVLRPALILAVVGLLVVAVAGALVVGSILDNTPVIVPPSPPPASGAAPVAPSVAPSASPTSFHVALKDEYASGATVDIVDLSGTLVSARAAEIGEREPNPGAPTTGDVVVKNVDATSLWIGWGAGACPDAHRLTIDPAGRSISITQPPFCGGDTVGVGRQLVLTFSGPIAAADIAATLVQVPAASPPP